MVFTRRDIWDLETEQAWHPITRAYATAVGLMQTQFSPDDPRHWKYQASIHGVPFGTPLEPGWDQCEHADWYFFPWHRVYLFFFERIVRAIVAQEGGPADWALPYWNYDGGGTKNALPLPFRDEFLPDEPTKRNPLYVRARRSGFNDGSRSLRPEVTSPAAGLALSNFTSPPRPSFGGGPEGQGGVFGNGGQMEQTPHNDVHVELGGWMGDPGTAALDPIFWLHHANVDRLWNRWSANPANRPLDNGGWLTERYTFFDADGAPADKTPRDVLSTQSDLDYRYDDDAMAPHDARPEPAPSDALRPREQLIGASEPTRLVGRALSVPLTFDVGADANELVERNPESRVVLSVEHVDAKINPGVVYGVYLEGFAPKPVHVGNISLFGIERIRRRKGVEDAHDMRLDYDVTAVVGDQIEKLKGTGVAVRFEPLTSDEEQVEGADAGIETVHPPIEVGRVSLAIS